MRSSTHSFGAEVGAAVKVARQQLQQLLGATHDHEIIYTSGGTESDNAAILSALEALPDRNEIVTSKVEHPAILSLCEHLEKTGRAKVHFDRRRRSASSTSTPIARRLSDKVAVVSLMWANNETGTIFPVEGLAELAKEHGALFHTDAVQAVGKIPISLKDSAIDMLSLSGHKLHGPKGIGALYVKKGARFKPLIRGGHQERGRRAGTENTPAIIGLGKAAELAHAHMADEQGACGSCAIGSRSGSAARAELLRQWRSARSPAEHHQYRIRICRGRSHSAASQPQRNRGVVGFGLHLRVARAVPCDAGDECSVHRAAWLDPLLLLARQCRRGCRSGDRGAARDRREAARNCRPSGRTPTRRPTSSKPVYA